MTTTHVEKWAAYLHEAERSHSPVSPLSELERDLTLSAAYDIQRCLVHKRLEEGERIVGAKVGFTSRAKQLEMGINEPIYGVLTDAMLLGDDGALCLGQTIHPRAEPEIAFVLAKELAGPGVTVHDVLAATSCVCSGIEVIDSRYQDFRFSLVDVVADNASACRFALGSYCTDPTSIDLRLAGCLFEEDGEVVDTAAGAAILGHPAVAVAALANFFSRQDRVLEPGWVVLSGGLTAARRLRAGSWVSAAVAGLGSVSVRVLP